MRVRRKSALLLFVGLGFRVSRRDIFFPILDDIFRYKEDDGDSTRSSAKEEAALSFCACEREREAFAKRSPFCGATLSLSLSGFCARVSRVCFLIAFHFLFPADCKEFEREREREKEREKERDERGRW